MVILSVDGVTAGYGKKEVLTDVSFKMDPGEFIGVIGPNGCGKSTLVRAITSVISLWKGDILVDDQPIDIMSRKELARNVAVVPQNTYINFPFKVEEIVKMGRTPYLDRFENLGERDFKLLKRAMDVTGTYQFKDRKVNELSGGELQRVITARALSQDPKLLLLDEATSHLDIGHKLEMMDIIKQKCHEEGVGVLSIFHNLDLAARYCERIILVDEGKVHAKGIPEEVLTPPHLRAVYGIEAEVHENPRDGSLYITPARKKDINGQKDMRVHVVCGGGSSGKLMKVLVEYGFDVTAGVLNVMDSDYEKAKFLDIETVLAPPFSPMNGSDLENNRELIRRSDVVIGTEFPVGHGNIKNMESIQEAAEMGKHVILIRSSPLEKRDYTGGKATKLYDDITSHKNCRVVKDQKQAVSLLKDLYSSRHNA